MKELYFYKIVWYHSSSRCVISMVVENTIYEDIYYVVIVVFVFVKMILIVWLIICYTGFETYICQNLKNSYLNSKFREIYTYLF